MINKVVWAIQSPGLLNALSLSSKWDLQVADLGDATGFDELRNLRVPVWNGLVDGVSHVFVCSPLQFERATAIFPHAEIVQVAHQGYRNRVPVPTSNSHIVCFTEGNRVDLRQWYTRPIHVLTPAFEVSPTWTWMQNDAWSVMSRPSVRPPMAWAGVAEIKFRNRNIKHRWYGQDNEGGFLGLDQMAAKKSRCSCYLTMLPPSSGIGLTEHECMASGVPLVGAMLGACDEWLIHSGLGLFFDFDAISEDLQELCFSSSAAKLASQECLEYIERFHSQEKLDESVEKLLDET